jgi:hypothetical protein
MTKGLNSFGEQLGKVNDLLVKIVFSTKGFKV